MSLNAHDRRALTRIEEALADADPRFVARVAAFSRLTDDEALPERERIREARRPGIDQALRCLRPGQPGAHKLMYWIAVAMAVCITLALICSAPVIGHGDTEGGCAQWQAVTCVRQAPPSAPVPSGHKGHAPSLTP